MTSVELRMIRLHLRLTQAELGEALGVQGRVIRRWEAKPGVKSGRPIPVPVGRIVMLMAGMPEPVDMMTEERDTAA